MNRGSRFAAAGGVFAAVGLFAFDRLARRRKVVLTVDQEMPATASQVVHLIKQVEREPEFIPLISSVSVHDRTEADVRYTTHADLPLRASARYRKWWEDTPVAVFWATEDATMGFHNNGQIRFTERDGTSIAHVRSEHWLAAPLIGRLAGPALASILRRQFEAWLWNLARELRKARDLG